MSALIDYLKDLYAREPLRINAVLATVVVAGAAAVGVVVDAEVVATLIGSVLALVLTSEATRPQVASPATQAAAVPDAPDA